MHKLRHIIFIFISIFATVPSFAQITTSALDGRVSDKNELAVPGVVITATHLPTGTVYHDISDNKGYYNIKGMRPGGPYTLEFSCLGYKTMKFTEIFLLLAESNTINPNLEESIEELQASFIVSEAVSRFANTETGAVSNIKSSDIELLPKTERTIEDIIRLSPYGGKGLSIAGHSGRLVNFTIDGANFNNNMGIRSSLAGGGRPISINALQEIQVALSPYDVRQNNFIAAGVNAISKSGTNTFKLDAHYLQETKNSIYGISVEGPVIQNKLFYYINLELSSRLNVLSKWQASEDGIADSSKNISRTKISDMQLVSDFVKEKYGYDTGSFDNFYAPKNTVNALGRIDWNTEHIGKLSVRFSYSNNREWHLCNATSMDGGEVPSIGRISASSMVFRNSLYRMDNKVWSGSINLNTRFSRDFHNELLATFSVHSDKRESNSKPFPFIDILEPDANGVLLPYMSLGYELFSYNNYTKNSTINIKDDITYYWTSHTLTAGIDYEHQDLKNTYLRNGTGYYRYSSLSDFLNEASPEVVCLSYGYDTDITPYSSIHFDKLDAYIQDMWAITDEFKLNYGIRVEKIFYINDGLKKSDQIYDIDYSGNGYHILSDNDSYSPEEEALALRINTETWPSDKLSFSPRIGFNWDVFGNNRLKIKGGTGVFTGRIPLVLLLNMPNHSGMYINEVILNGSGKYNADKTDMSLFQGGLIRDSQGKASIEALRNYIIDNKLAAESFGLDFGDVSSYLVAIDPDFRMPQAWKSSISFDYKLPTSFPLSLSGEFIYSKSIYDVCIKDISLKELTQLEHFNGADDRYYYGENPKKPYKSDTDDTEIGVPSAYMVTNTDQGYGINYSLTLNSSPVKNLDLSLTYSHSSNYILTGVPDPSVNSLIPYIPNINGLNNLKLHLSPDSTPARFLTNAKYKSSWGSTFSLVYESILGKKSYSYMYANDFNNDGYNFDLIYIPRDRSEIRFVSTDDENRFWDYVDSDQYLSSHKGQYAQAYSLHLPWTHIVDFLFTQDFKFKIKEQTQTLQLSLNIMNILNNFVPSYHLNPALRGGYILKYEGLDSDNYPTFSTISTIKDNVSTWTLSKPNTKTWNIQLGLRYMF